MLSALVLLKHVGLNLAIFAGIICCIDVVILRYFSKRNSTHFSESFISFKYISWIVVLFIFPLLTSLSWKYFVQVHDLTHTWGNMSLGLFFNKSLSCCTSPREIEVAQHFFTTFFDLINPSFNSTTIIGFGSEAITQVNWLRLMFYSSDFNVARVIISLSLGGILGACFFSTHLKRARFILLNLEITFCTLLYSASLLLVYLYGLSDFEAKILISFQRYHNVFLLAWTLILLYMFVELYRDTSSKNKHLILTLIVLCVSFWSFYSVTSSVKRFLTKGAWPASDQRAEIRKIVMPLKNYIPPQAKVYITWYGSNGWEFWMAKYEFLPRITNLFCFSLGPKLNQNDMYSCKFEPKIIKDYDFLLVGKGLKVLKKNYPSYFNTVPEDIDDGLLKIEKNKNNISLKFLQP